MALWVVYLHLVLLVLSSSRLGVFGEDEEEEQENEQADAANVQPRFTSVSGEHTVLAGRTATLPCRVADIGDTDAAVQWFKVGPLVDDQGNINEQYNPDEPGPVLFIDQTRITTDTRIQISDSGDENDHSLHIVDVSAYDSGPYECRISTTPPIIQRQILKVRVPPRVSIVPDSNPYIVEPGHSLNLNCYGAGYPQPNMVWSREGGPLPDGRASHKSKEQAQLFYDNIGVNHSGVYHCTADNGVGDIARGQITVEVVSKDAPKNPPSVQTDRKFIAVDEGQNVSLSCNYSANPLPQVTWSFERFPMNPQSQKYRERMTFSQPVPSQDVWTTTLTISNVQESDFGEYLCRISNNLGTVEETIDVSGKPGPPYAFTAAVYGDRIDFLWRLESAPDVLGYKLFYRKRNEDFSLSLEVPAKSGRHVKDNEWVANYSLRLDASPASLLKPNTEYQFAVQGVNRFGDGSLPKPLLDVRTPAKFEGGDETVGKPMDTDKAKGYEGQQGTLKSMKAGDDGNGAAKLKRPARVAVLGVFAPLLLALYLRALA